MRFYLKVSVLFLMLVLFFGMARAQNQANSDAILVATVNLYDANIVSQDQNKVTVGFDINNRYQVQPNIKYGIILIQSNGKTSETLDTYVSDEVLSLGENQTVHKEIVYSAPQYLQGNFQIWIVAKNESGLTLSFNKAGDIKLSGNNQYLSVSDCYLKVKGDAENINFKLQQGVDVDSNENLMLYCQISNNQNIAISTQPEFVVYRRNIFGEKVGLENQPEMKSIDFKANEKKEIALEIPKPTTPQAYDAVLSFSNVSSNSIVAHFVVRGESATIQTAQLNKDFYQSGDTASLSVFWTSSADNFVGARKKSTTGQKLTLSGSITDGNGQICGSIPDFVLNQETLNPKFSISIAQNCVNPTINLKISDEKGKVIDEKKWTIQSQNVQLQKMGVSRNQKSLLRTIILILIIIVFFISLAVIIVRKRKSGMMIFLSLLVMSGWISFDIHKAQADTFAVLGNSTVTTYTVTPMKKAFNPGENIVFTYLSDIGYCSNGYAFSSLYLRSMNDSENKSAGNRTFWDYTNDKPYNFNYIYDRLNDFNLITKIAEYGGINGGDGITDSCKTDPSYVNNIQDNFCIDSWPDKTKNPILPSLISENIGAGEIRVSGVGHYCFHSTGILSTSTMSVPSGDTCSVSANYTLPDVGMSGQYSSGSLPAGHSLDTNTLSGQEKYITVMGTSWYGHYCEGARALYSIGYYVKKTPVSYINLIKNKFDSGETVPLKGSVKVDMCDMSNINNNCINGDNYVSAYSWLISKIENGTETFLPDSSFQNQTDALSVVPAYDGTVSLPDKSISNLLDGKYNLRLIASDKGGAMTQGNAATIQICVGTGCQATCSNACDSSSENYCSGNISNQCVDNCWIQISCPDQCKNGLCIITQPKETCGDGKCSSGENCHTCEKDCGKCSGWQEVAP